MSTSVAVTGATGRLGTLVCQVIEEHPEFALAARLTSQSDPASGSGADILVDVSHPDASPAIVERAVRAGQKVVVGTSGWSAERIAGLEELVAETPGAGVIVVPNFSLGSVLGTALARIAAPFFDSIEIVETHHPRKVDSPSGTAVRTAEIMAEARGGKPADAPFAEQEARGQLVAGIPVHSLRLAGVSAKQEVHLGGPGETLTLTHNTSSNEAYRAGIVAALTAVRDASGVTVGLDSVLGLDGLGSGAGSGSGAGE
ncbi:4-hydroxy-tetrahydrodipicolinate reductase [Leucobacter luti]|uniref:4-hydroxy-tetrahydrodipicolinate reductase n=1 Tax=Leucobacter luti TaxID=340320 RepID=UPI003CFEFDA8